MSDVKKCANPVCSCIPPEKEKYCSAHCEGMGDKVEVMCGCGHATCSGEVSEPVIRRVPIDGTIDPEVGAL